MDGCVAGTVARITVVGMIFCIHPFVRSAGSNPSGRSGYLNVSFRDSSHYPNTTGYLEHVHGLWENMLIPICEVTVLTTPL